MSFLSKKMSPISWALLMLIMPHSLHAFSCRRIPLETQISESGMIFEGEVVQVDYILVPKCKLRNLRFCPTEKHPGGRGSYITFKVKKSWKGTSEGEYIIRREGSSFINGRSFKVGESWIIFSKHLTRKDSRSLYIISCFANQKSNPDFIKKLDAHFKKK